MVTWHDTEAIRDMPELSSEDKLTQIPNAATATTKEACDYFGHNRRYLKSESQTHPARDKLENWAGKKHVELD